MNNILVVYGTGIRSRISFEFVNTQLRFIENIKPDNNYYFCSFSKNINSTKKILNVRNIKEVVDLYNYFSEPCWLKGFKEVDKVIEKYNINQVYMYGMPCIHNNDNEVSVLETIYDKSKDDENYCDYSSFSFLFRHIKFHLLPFYANKKYNIEVHQFVNDPLEIDFTGFLSDYHRWSFLSNTKNSKFHPYIDYGHTRREIPKDLDKELVFFFGSSDLPDYDSQGKRTKIIDELIKVDNPLFKYLVKSKRYNIDTTVKQDEYNRLVSKSYFSYVIPSHDNNSFSFIRFLDIIHSGTVPLISPYCNIDCAFNIPLRKDLKDLIHKYELIKSVEEIEKLCNVKKDRLDMYLKMFLDEYKSTSYYEFLHKI